MTMTMMKLKLKLMKTNVASIQAATLTTIKRAHVANISKDPVNLVSQYRYGHHPKWTNLLNFGQTM